MSLGKQIGTLRRGLAPPAMGQAAQEAKTSKLVYFFTNQHGVTPKNIKSFNVKFHSDKLQSAVVIFCNDKDTVRNHF